MEVGSRGPVGIKLRRASVEFGQGETLFQHLCLNKACRDFPLGLTSVSLGQA